MNPPRVFASITIKASGIPRAQIEELLAIAGPDATFTFAIEKADRPGETRSTTITASWTNQRKEAQQ